MKVKNTHTATVAMAALLAAALFNCGDDDNPLGPTSPCDTIYEGQCGTACVADSQCPAGLHCSASGQCHAACISGKPCPGGLCDDRGRCDTSAPGIGGNFPSGPGDGATSPGGGDTCGAVEVEFEPTIPTVVLLIDQSGSMTNTFGGDSRWDVVYDVLMDPDDGVVKTLEQTVRFALVLYTYNGGPTCPSLVKMLPPSLGNHGAIDGIYSPQSPMNDTPTGDSITEITPELVAFAEPGPKLIILATDGEPDRCADPDGHDDISKNLAVNAVKTAHNQGIDTVIIAVGKSVSLSHQQDMANAGQGLPVPAPNPCTDPSQCAATYEPATKQAMIDAFKEIINGQRSCVFTLDGQVIPGKECEGTVQLNGETIACNDPNGWQLNGTSEIEFVGAACDAIMNDPNVDIQAEWPCTAVVIPN